MSERKRIPVKLDGQVIGQAEVTETEEGVTFEMKLPSPGPEALEQLQRYAAASFAFREPDPDLLPHDPLAPQPPRIRDQGELPCKN